MKLFDLHADLAEAIKNDYGKMEGSVLQKQWMPGFKEGEIAFTAAASFFCGKEDWDQMQATVRMVRDDIEKSGAPLILTAEDLKKEYDTTAFLMTIEGMCGIEDEPEEKIQWLYDMGNRIGSLEWNEQNELATGNWGDPCRGLTEMGKRAVRKMNELHMIVDVSHANEKTFWDLLDESSLPIIATHSNAKSLCTVERNLTNQQIRALCAKGGLIGLNACESFLSDDAEKRNARQLARHARHIASLAGVEHLACGFDFGAYYSSSETHDLKSPWQAQNFIHGLYEEGFSEDEIKDIAYRNVQRFLQKYM